MNKGWWVVLTGCVIIGLSLTGCATAHRSPAYYVTYYSADGNTLKVGGKVICTDVSPASAEWLEMIGSHIKAETGSKQVILWEWKPIAIGDMGASVEVTADE